jgi:hypothetical protein
VPQVRALETNLWGYRFRSRLEARWAVYFDCLNVPWQYEHEGFLLPSGPYLPDFFLPSFGLWFEVKGRQADDEERQRCRELSYSDYPVLLAEGTIGDGPLTLFAFALDNDGGGEVERSAFLSHSGLHVRNNSEEDHLCNHCFDPLKCSVFDEWKDGWRFSFGSITAARSARFEHGQSPERRSAC